MSLLLISHISIALLTLVIVTLAYLKPTTLLLKFNSAAASLTLATGVTLTVLNPSHLLQTCLTGIVYFGAVTTVTVLARRKLAAAQSA